LIRDFLKAFFQVDLTDMQRRKVHSMNEPFNSTNESQTGKNKTDQIKQMRNCKTTTKNKCVISYTSLEQSKLKQNETVYYLVLLSIRNLSEFVLISMNNKLFLFYAFQIWWQINNLFIYHIKTGQKIKQMITEKIISTLWNTNNFVNQKFWKFDPRVSTYWN
jgi:hypothetical protein